MKNNESKKNSPLANQVFVAESSIHGKGVYAKVRIPKGSYIGTYMGPSAKRNGTYVLWLIDEKGAEVGRSGRNQLRYLNHSNKPNAVFEDYELYARRNIRVEEEITFNYNPNGPSPF